MQVLSLKVGVLSLVGVMGSFILSMFGGWSDAMTALLVFMLIDILTGIAVAAFFKTSIKTESGTLSSKIMSRGLCRKGAMLLIILGTAQLDMMLSVNYIREATIIAFCANEFLSVLENCGLMGIKFPTVITKAVELLQIKADQKND